MTQIEGLLRLLGMAGLGWHALGHAVAGIATYRVLSASGLKEARTS